MSAEIERLACAEIAREVAVFYQNRAREASDPATKLELRVAGEVAGTICRKIRARGTSVLDGSASPLAFSPRDLDAPGSPFAGLESAISAAVPQVIGSVVAGLDDDRCHYRIHNAQCKLSWQHDGPHVLVTDLLPKDSESASCVFMTGFGAGQALCALPLGHAGLHEPMRIAGMAPFSPEEAEAAATADLALCEAPGPAAGTFGPVRCSRVAGHDGAHGDGVVGWTQERCHALAFNGEQCVLYCGHDGCHNLADSHYWIDSAADTPIERAAS